MDEHEKVDDILSEMETEKPGLMNAPLNSNNAYYARRLRNAYRWESQLKYVTDGLVVMHDSEMGTLARVGDMSKMRTALEKTKRVLERISRSAWFIDANFGETTDVLETRQLVDEALASPARNCDIGSVDEQSKRLHEFCDSHGHGFDGQKCYCCENCQFISIDRCELAWAQKPYEGGGKVGETGSA